MYPKSYLLFFLNDIEVYISESIKVQQSEIDRFHITAKIFNTDS